MHRLGGLALTVALAAVAAGCGTRLSDDAFTARSTAERIADVAPGERVLPPGGGTTGSAVAPVDDGTTAGTAGTAGTAASGAPGLGDPGAPGTTGTSGAPATSTSGSPTAGTDGAATTGGTATGDAGGPNRASDVGVTPTSVRIGNITAVSGPLGDAFAPSQRGLQAWVAATNAKGGIRGRRIELVTCDDLEDRTRSLQCAQKLVERDKVFAFVANNSRALGGAAPYINAAGVPDFAGEPITNGYYRWEHYYSIYANGYPRDNKTVGWKGKLYNFPTGTFRWFLRTLGVKKVGVFYYGDVNESKQAVVAMGQALKLEGAAVTEFNVNFANPDFDQAINQMRREGIEAVWDGLDDGANRKFCDALQRANYTLKAKVSTIVAWGQSVGETYGDKCRPVFYSTGDSRPYGQTSIPAIKEFRDAYAKYKPRAELHEWALEGWQAGMWLGDGLEAMGASPTRKGLEAWVESLHDYTIHDTGTPRDFQPIDYDAPTVKECYSIVQWSDAAKTFVSRAFECVPDAKQFGTVPSEQGD